MHRHREGEPPPGPRRRRAVMMLGVGVAAILVASACGANRNSDAAPPSTPASTAAASSTSSPTVSPSSETASCGTDDGTGCAPEGDRVDLAEPSFPDPTNVTNLLFPISELRSALLLGNVDGQSLRVETTLLPDTKTIELNGQQVEALVSQYVAYLDGRIEEVALDFYAQAADGAVWYFGEDVFNYQDGAVADTEGTWLAGKDGPVAMIMPGDPQVGDVFRPENSLGVVFEEVTVKAIAQTVAGPRGLIDGAIVTDELHTDGRHEEKVFAPGYGEFSTGAYGDLEALAIAVPTDASTGPSPAELATVSAGALAIFDAVDSEDWDAASATLGEIATAWDSYRAGGDLPELLEAQMNRALDALAGDALAPAVEGRNSPGARKAAIDVALASLDLQLGYRPPAEIDLARFDLWARQLVVDAAGDEPGEVAGDVTVLEWIWDRIAHTVDTAAAGSVDVQLGELRSAVDEEDVTAVAEATLELLETITGLESA